MSNTGILNVSEVKVWYYNCIFQYGSISRFGEIVKVKVFLSWGEEIAAAKPVIDCN